MSDYALFDMCPFTQVQIGGGGGIGFDIQQYVWTHGQCIRYYCKLYVAKFDEQTGQVYAEGCSLQFLGLTQLEILQNMALRERMIETQSKTT